MVVPKKKIERETSCTSDSCSTFIKSSRPFFLLSAPLHPFTPPPLSKTQRVTDTPLHVKTLFWNITLFSGSHLALTLTDKARVLAVTSMTPASTPGPIFFFKKGTQHLKLKYIKMPGFGGGVKVH